VRGGAILSAARHPHGYLPPLPGCSPHPNDLGLVSNVGNSCEIVGPLLYVLPKGTSPFPPFPRRVRLREFSHFVLSHAVISVIDSPIVTRISAALRIAFFPPFFRIGTASTSSFVPFS